MNEAKAGRRAVFFVDAAHFVYGAFLAFAWCMERVWIKAPSGRQRFNVLGAINAITRETVTIVNSTDINSQSVCELLYKIAALRLSMPITLVLDNARYQRCTRVQDLALRLDIELLFLPAYSPNLNLIERLWKFVKRQCLYAAYYTGFSAFTEAIQGCLEQTHTTHRKALASWPTLNFQAFENDNL